MTITSLHCGNNINCIFGEYLIQFLSLILVLFLVLFINFILVLLKPKNTKKIKKLQNKN